MIGSKKRKIKEKGDKEKKKAPILWNIINPTPLLEVGFVVDLVLVDPVPSLLLHTVSPP